MKEPRVFVLKTVRGVPLCSDECPTGEIMKDKFIYLSAYDELKAELNAEIEECNRLRQSAIDWTFKYANAADERDELKREKEIAVEALKEIAHPTKWYECEADLQMEARQALDRIRQGEK